MDTRDKIVAPADAPALARERRAAGERVALVSGFFDPLLAAHALRLREIAQASQALFVAIEDPPQPLLEARARAELVAGLRVVDYVVLAGQAGLAGHLKLGNRVTVAAQSGVMNNIPDGEKWFGSPAQPDRMMKRQLIALQQLPDLLKRVSELEKRPGPDAPPAAPASAPPAP